METLDVKNIELPIKPLSQKEYKDKKLRNEICSPTCLTMALNYFGKKVNLDDTIKGVLIGFETRTCKFLFIFNCLKSDGLRNKV